MLYEGVKAKPLQEQIDELGFVPTIYSPEYNLLNPDLVKECKSIGMKVVPWTVNDVKSMQELIDMGVDGIITDFPNLFGQLF